MKTILKSSIFTNNIFVKTYTNDLEMSTLQEDVMEIDNEEVKGVVREIQLDGINITIREVATINYEINVSHDFPLFKLHFEIEGCNQYKPINSSEKSIYIPGGHYNLFYLPKVNGILSYKTNYRKTLEIIFTEKYLKKILGKDFKDTLQKLGKAITYKEPFVMWETSRPISTELQSSIKEIINCEYLNNLKKVFLETKVNELLLILLAKTIEENYIETNIELSKENYAKIIEVEKYIKNNLKRSLTIPELAAVVGINTSKLKQDFKVVFSLTIFKHITKLRMEKAKKLILNENYTIAEASYKVGYKHSQHFTVAFKKMYGYLPSILNKK